MPKKIAWLPEESAKLKELLEARTPYREIARILGRSRTSCESHAFRIGVTHPHKAVDEEPLDEPVYTTRMCLSCLLPFQSISVSNRLCSTCRKHNAYI
jgi:hypothetical protein